MPAAGAWPRREEDREVIAAIAALMAVAVVVVVAAERAGRRAPVLAAKPLASLCFVVVAWSRLRPGSPYDAWVMLALLLCLAGDVLLLFRRAFVAGLVAFLIGHLTFVVAFAALLPPHAWPAAWALVPLAASAAAAVWLSPSLGRMRSPVLAYVAVITVMVWGALSVAAAGHGPWLVAVGALLFYLSDLTVAYDRFVKGAFAVRTLGLPAYYLGQLLFALSVGPAAPTGR
jgi:uncharacterized membrane protein YhhN